MTPLEELVNEYRSLCDDWDRLNCTGPLGSRGVPLPSGLWQFERSCAYASQCFLRVATKAAMNHRITRQQFREAVKGNE